MSDWFSSVADLIETKEAPPAAVEGFTDDNRGPEGHVYPGQCPDLSASDARSCDLQAPPSSGSVVEPPSAAKHRSPGRPRGVEPSAQYDSKIESNGGGSLSTGLFNARPPHYTIKHERWEHRDIAVLKAQGFTNVEIAAKTGFSAVCVSNVLRQPWIADLIADAQAKAGRDAVHEVLKASALDSVLTLIDLRDTCDNPEVQRKSSNDLLNRLYGMPSQPIAHTTELNLDNMSDAQLAKVIAKANN